MAIRHVQVKQDYEYVLHRGNLGLIIELDKPAGTLFDRSIYEFATHKWWRANYLPICLVLRRQRRRAVQHIWYHKEK
jgi:hypothetical protein